LLEDQRGEKRGEQQQARQGDAQAQGRRADPHVPDGWVALDARAWLGAGGRVSLGR